MYPIYRLWHFKVYWEYKLHFIYN